MKKYCLILLLATLWRPSPAPAQAAASADFAADLSVIIDSQRQAIDQARQALSHGGEADAHAALEAAVKEMERSQTALETAKKSPDKLPAALAAEQSAYQALLKATPREYRMNRSRSRSQGGGAGQPSEQETSQLELTGEDNRYETEKQAEAPQSAQQHEQSQTLDRLKQLARRQQDLNDRLRDLQTALQEVKTDSGREEIQRQLKRLRDEERQLLSDVDETRQKMEQSPNAAQQAQARQQLDKTRNDVQRAAQELENQSVSEALAAGSRAEENLQNARENLRQQSSSQFAEQMRQLRAQARDLAGREDQIAHDLDRMNHSGQKPLDDSAPRQALVEQLARQQSALTNLLGQMRDVTEQAESTEPLLSKQLYDILRRADQSHTDSQLEMSGRLVDRGFLPQAAEAEKPVQQSLDDLRKNVDRAAESVLGSETDALKYAQKQLDDLASQLTKDLAPAANTATNGNPSSQSSARGNSNKTNPGEAAVNQTQNPPEPNQSPNPGQSPGGQQAPNPGQGSGQRETANATQPASGQGQGAATGPSQQAAGDNSSQTDLNQFAKQLGAAGGAGGLGENGPITGGNYAEWADRMRDVEQAIDSQDVRNQLATVRERVGAYRTGFRQSGRLPPPGELQNKALAPLSLARDWIGQELSRAQNDRSLVPLDRDPVPDKYSDLVRKYYEKLGSPQ
jgi:hypothetical protein